MKKQVNRPDFSNLLAHFTTGRAPVGNTDKENPVKEIAKGTALKRLISILEQRRIVASTMPWTNCRAVCFTECPWTSLIEHTRNYAPFGIGFSKEVIFSADGAPVYYVRADQYTKQKWGEELHPFVTPFWPEYRPDSLKNKTKIKKTCDYSHEREWRTPHDFLFEYSQIEFIVLRHYDDMAKFPKELKDAIGREKFLLMENYKMIEKLWPVHNLGIE